MVDRLFNWIYIHKFYNHGFFRVFSSNKFLCSIRIAFIAFNFSSIICLSLWYVSLFRYIEDSISFTYCTGEPPENISVDLLLLYDISFFSFDNFDLIMEIPCCKIFIRNDIIPVNEKPMHIPRVPPTEPTIEIASYIKYSSYTVVEL